MSKKQRVKFTSRIELSSRGEEHVGWIRVPRGLRDSIRSGTYVKVAHGSRTTVCQVRGLPGETDTVHMSEHYRDVLGIDAVGDDVTICLSPVGLRGKLKALATHPDDPTRFAFGLGFTGLALGSISLFVAVIPTALETAMGLILSSETESSVTLWTSIVALIMTAFVGIGLVLVTALLGAYGLAGILGGSGAGLDRDGLTENGSRE